jgi:hypothetical protein
VWALLSLPFAARLRESSIRLLMTIPEFHHCAQISRISVADCSDLLWGL